MAQITGVVFSTLVWVVVAGLSIPALALVLAAGVAAIAARNTRAMLWWRFGATRAHDYQRDAMLAAIVPIASLRGRHQPTIWIGRRLDGANAVMPTRTDLVISLEFVSQVVGGQLTDRQVSAIVRRALGCHEVHGSSLVNAMDAYSLPWRLVRILTSAASQVSDHKPILKVSWEIRWVVFGAAAVDSYRNGRWAALIGVILIAVLSWSTGYFQNRWLRTLQHLGDQPTLSVDFDEVSPTLSAHSRLTPSVQARRTP